MALVNALPVRGASCLTVSVLLYVIYSFDSIRILSINLDPSCQQGQPAAVHERRERREAVREHQGQRLDREHIQGLTDRLHLFVYVIFICVDSIDRHYLFTPRREVPAWGKRLDVTFPNPSPDLYMLFDTSPHWESPLQAAIIVIIPCISCMIVI